MQINGSCHCGRIAFAAEGEFDTAMECNCSYCRRQGVLLGFVPREKFELTTPRKDASVYWFNRQVIAHYFCGHCGIAPFGEAAGPDGREMTAINLRCVPELDLKGLVVKQYDGASV